MDGDHLSVMRAWSGAPSRSEYAAATGGDPSSGKTAASGDAD
jgi:hypothetical protein